MIDIHTHFLPGIDDGSADIVETLAMLDIMAKSGVNKVVATPHFYSEITTIDDFLEKRNAAYESIADKIPDSMEVRLGAEVMLGYDIYKQDLKKLAIEGTDYILVEMPYDHWDPWVFDELFKITSKHTLEIIIAHVERYVGIVPRNLIDKLFDMKLKYQVNVDYLGGFFRKSEAMKMIKSGNVHFLGSDCHNVTDRVPCMGDAIKVIESRAGKDVARKYMKNAEKMLG